MIFLVKMFFSSYAHPSSHLNTCVLLLMLYAPSCLTFDMEGSQTSYAKFPTWAQCQNGSLTFEFETSQPNGLLMYADDGGKYDFFEVKLVGGVARLRLNLGGGTSILSVGHNLNNGKWHKIEVHRKRGDTTFVVDNIAQTQQCEGTDYEFGELEVRDNSFMYIGGLPIGFSARLSQLALPSVMFEPRFRGNIRNVLYANCAAPMERMEMIEHDGVRTNNADECQERNMCQNGGICISTDTGSFCDCTRTDFEGPHCQIGKSV